MSESQVIPLAAVKDRSPDWSFFSGADLGRIASRLAAGERIKSATDDLVESWTEFLLRFDMQWFCTMTFETAIHPEAADKKYRVWVSKLNRHLYGANYYKHPQKGVFWIRALEWQKRDVLHYHALVGDARNLNHQAMRYVFKAEWSELAGYGKIDAINPGMDSARAVRSYVSKYVAKGGQVDLSPTLRWYLQPMPEIVLS